MSISVLPLPLIYGFVHILVFGHSCWFPLQSVPSVAHCLSKGTCTSNQPAPSFALPHADWAGWLNAKISTESSSAVLIWEVAPQQLQAVHHTAQLQLCSLLQHTEPCSCLWSFKVCTQSWWQCSLSQQWVNDQTLAQWGKSRGEKGIWKRNRETGWGLISRYCKLFPF